MSDYRPFPYSPDDHQAWEALMPFYLAHTLPQSEAYALEAHLSTCARCREALEDWRAIANATHQVAAQRSHQLPPLSNAVRQQVVQESVQRRTPQQQPLPKLTMMPRQAEPRQAALPATPLPAVSKARPATRRSSPWLTRIAAVFVFVTAAGIVMFATRDTLRTLSFNPTQMVSQLTTAPETATPISTAVSETTAEVTENIESLPPTATPWNTVMPIRPSPTPTVTITSVAPQPTLTTTQQQVNPVTDAPLTTIMSAAPATSTVDASPTVTRDRGSVAETTPAILQFSVVPNTVQPGQTLTVRWDTTGANYIEIAAAYDAVADFKVVHTSAVSTNSISVTIPPEVRKQAIFELRLYGIDTSGTAEASTTADQMVVIPLAASAQVSVAIQCPYIYLLYGNTCPDASATEFAGTVQRFEHGWIVRRNDLGEGVVLFDNGMVSANESGQPILQTTAPDGLLLPDTALTPYYQAALGWAQAPAKDVVIEVSKLDAAAASSMDDGSQQFAIEIYGASTEPTVLSLEMEWAPASSAAGGNFTQWRSVS